MIKLTNLNKYFNKGKSNEIHVINNTSLQFPNKGLISLLGASGSGKTTLLNVVGGLDKTSGDIEFKDELISSKNFNEWDKIRVNNIGYIFQNYYLLDNKTVYENIEMVLTLMGITNKEEVKYRTEYVLDKVGMLRFKNRLASDLSGGQKQRVAIARAVVKNPDVIIADEPTGNLDTNNSIEVLKIIKEISKEKLVLLVTHNESLANNYSDRIINIVDGKVVSDQADISSLNDLKYIDNNLYLQDLNHINNKNINIYTNKDIDNLEFTIVKVDNNYYLKTSEKNATVKILNEDSEIKLIDDKSENFKEKLTVETDFDLKDLEALNTPRTKSQIYTFKDSFKEAFRRLTNLGRRGKIQIVALVFLGISFVSALFMFSSVLFIDTNSIDHEKNIYYKQYYEKMPLDSLPDDAVVFSRFRMELVKGSFTQSIYGINIAPKEVINKQDTSPDVVYIDETVLDSSFSSSYLFKAFGINKKEHFINQELNLNYRTKVTIAGTVKTNTKTIYIDSGLLKRILLQQSYSAEILTDDVEIITTNVNPVNENGIISIYIPQKFNGEEELSEETYLSYYGFGKDYKVAGYHTHENESMFYIDDESFITLLLVEPGFDFYFYSLAENINPGYVDEYQYKLDEIKQNKQIGLGSSIAQALINLGIGLLLFYFLVRSSLSNRRKEISILRSLGISKKEVRRAFAIEYFIITTFTSLIGVIIGNFIMYKISGSFIEDIFKFDYSPIVTLASIALIYGFNIFISLIPVNSILRKTPAQLLTNYDL